MSFLMIQDVVKTSVLSKRWKNLWKHLPHLKLNTSEFRKPLYFSEFVSGIVSSHLVVWAIIPYIHLTSIVTVLFNIRSSLNS
jgi:hypothetical protein